MFRHNDSGVGSPFTYDAFGRLYSVPDVVTSTTYEADGQTRLISYANAVGTSFTYDPERRWLSTIHTQNSANPAVVLQHLAYTATI